MHHPGTFATELHQDLAKSPRQLGIKHPDELVVRTPRVQERPEHIENGTLPLCSQQLARLCHCLEGRVVERSEKEAEPGFLQTRDDSFLRQINLDAQRLQHIRATRFGGDATITMLRHADTARSQNEHRGAGHIEQMQLVATRAHDIQHRTGQLGAIKAGIDR